MRWKTENNLVRNRRWKTDHDNDKGNMSYPTKVYSTKFSHVACGGPTQYDDFEIAYIEIISL